MFIVDDVESLKETLKRIKKSPLSARSISLEKDLMEAAFWARRLLENINKLNFKQYGHTLDTKIHAISATEKIKGKFVSTQNRNISFRYLCSKMVHVVKFDLREDAQYWLDITNERGENFQVFYRDFIKGLESLGTLKETGSLGTMRLGR